MHLPRRHGSWTLSALAVAALGLAAVALVATGFPERAAPEVVAVGDVATRHSVVSGGSSAEREEYVSLADAAVGDVASIWGGDPAPVTVLLVPDVHAMAARLHASVAAVGERAALTVPASSVGRTGEPVVVVDTAAMMRLQPLGRRVVLTHEVVHVVTSGATPGSFPTWLSEGFADYVAFTAAAVPVRTAAGAALDRAGSGTVVFAPAADDFTAPAARADVAYQSAYLTCRVVADRFGPDKLVAWYRSVSGRAGTPHAVEDAVEDVFAVPYARFRRDARADVRALAASPATTTGPPPASSRGGGDAS